MKNENLTVNLDLENEVWKPVPEYEGYIASNLGRVIGPTGTILKSNSAGNGYFRVTMSKDKVSGTRSLHRIIASTWVDNPDPKHKTCVNHINGDKSDNRACNLEWVTHKENTHHAIVNGLFKRKRITLEMEEEIRDLFRQGKTNLEISKIYNVSSAAICHYTKGIRPCRRLTAEESKQVEDMFLEGKKPKEIAEFFGVSDVAINNRIRKLRTEKPRRKVSKEEHDEIIRLYQSGMSANDIAKKMDRWFTTIYKHIKKWKQLGT